MPTPNIYFVIFREDAVAFGQLIVPALVIMTIPALPVALLAWFIGERVQWRTFLAGIVIAWLSGAVGTWIAFPVLAGMAVVYRDVINDEPLKYHDIDARVVTILSLVGGCTCAYLTTLRYNRWIFNRQRNGPRPESPRRRLSFSLRTLLIAQLLLFAVMGLWLGARRPKVDGYNRYAKAESERQRQLEHAKKRFDRYGFRIELIGEEHRLRLVTGGWRLKDFRDEVLNLIDADDGLIGLELSSNNLTDEGLAIVSSHASLKELHINSAEITDEGIAHLQAITNLTRLGIQCDKVTSKSLDSLTAASKLSWLYIELPPNSETSIAEFRRARPDVQLQVKTRY